MNRGTLSMKPASSRPVSDTSLRASWKAILWGGLAAGLGDSILAIGLYRVPLIVVYQSVASGLLGKQAYRGGLATAALGLGLHFFIAITAAAVYVSASRRLDVLRQRAAVCGLAFGMAVYLFMKYLVLPLSAVVRLTPFESRAMIGHALLVGLPIALFARRVVHPPSDAPRVRD